MQENVLVTGAAGFIGSHLCEALLDRGYAVKGLDALTDSYPREQKEANLAELFRHRKKAFFEWYAADLLRFDLTALLQEISYVFHLAGEPGIRSSWGRDFSKYLERNILATQTLLESCSQIPSLKKFVFASSSSVYGEQGKKNLSENDSCEPFSPYGVTKLAAEKLCLAYAQNFALPIVCVRYFTVFGPRQRPDMGFHRFCKAALEGTAIKIFGDGEQTRDFTYVEDAVAATILAAENGKVGEVYNVGGGCLASVNEVLKMLGRLASPKSLQVTYGESAKGDVMHTQCNLSKSINELGFTPKIALQKGLTQEWEWIKTL